MLTQAQVKKLKEEMGPGDQKLLLVLQALSDEGRFRIFRLFMEEADLCVTDVAKVFGVSVPAVSQQLRIMEFKGLVNKKRAGKMVCYSIKKEERHVQAIMKIIKELKN